MGGLLLFGEGLFPLRSVAASVAVPAQRGAARDTLLCSASQLGESSTYAEQQQRLSLGTGCLQDAGGGFLSS